MKERLFKFLQRKTLGLVTILFCLGITVVLLYTSSFTSNSIREKSIRDATVLSLVISEFRTLYTSEVVEKVAPHGIDATHDYRQHSKAIPLPATMSIELADAIASKTGKESARLYSDFPFPWRTKDGGPRDDFERTALLELRKNPNQPYFRFEDYQGGPVLRYATADLMRPACIRCHNNLPTSPKKDWKVGDVRGVLEINLPIEKANEETKKGLKGVFLIIASVSLIGLSLLGFMIKKLGEYADEKQRLFLEAQQAVRARDNFIQMASHELKTPITSIGLQLQLLLYQAQDEKVIKLLNRSNEQIFRLNHLVDELLNVSRISAGKLQIELLPMDLSKLILKVVGQFHLEIERAGSSITVSAEQPVVGIWDELKIEQVIVNLLTNAIKYGKSAPIEIKSHQDGEMAVLSVKDHGIGIKSENIGRIFRKFERASDAGNYPGLGLGLYISKAIVEAHGGLIEVLSEEGKGSTFTVKLPLNPKA